MNNPSEKPESIVNEIVDDWAEISGKIDGLLGDFGPGQDELRAMFDSHRDVVETWAAVLIKKGKTADRDIASLRSAVVDLLLFHLYATSNSSTKKRAVVTALWATLEPAIKGSAEKLLAATRRLSDFGDRIEDLLQDGFLVFEDKVQRFEPAKGVRISTFISLCFRNYFINVLKRNSRKKQETDSEHLDLEVDPQDHDRNRLKLIEDVLQNEASRSSDMAQRVQAFRKCRMEGYTMEDVGSDLGRSLGWVQGCTKSIEKLLREELRD